MRLALVAASVLALCSCSCSSACDRAVCGACPLPIVVTVSLAGGGGPVTLSGDDAEAGIECALLPTGETRCSSATAGSGSYHVVVSAPGHVDRALDIVLASAPSGVCCACAGSFSDAVELVLDGAVDGGLPDAGRDAPELFDAPRVVHDAPTPDAAHDAGSCDQSAVRFFPTGGTLAVGQLCDDVFVCLGTEAEGSLVSAASDRFVCSSVPEGPCPASTCRYADPGGPSTLDAAEIAEICAVTVALPSPDLVCMVYL